MTPFPIRLNSACALSAPDRQVLGEHHPPHEARARDLSSGGSCLLGAVECHRETHVLEREARRAGRVNRTAPIWELRPEMSGRSGSCGIWFTTNLGTLTAAKPASTPQWGFDSSSA